MATFLSTDLKTFWGHVNSISLQYQIFHVRIPVIVMRLAGLKARPGANHANALMAFHFKPLVAKWASDVSETSTL